MARRAKDPQEKARAILTKASPAAAQLIVDAMKGEEGTWKEKLDCAKEVLNRVYGRAGKPLAAQQPYQLELELPEELEEDAR